MIFRNKLFFLSALWLTLAVVLFFPCQSFGQLEVSGFIRNYNAVELQPDHEFIIGRNRVRLGLNKEFAKGELYLSNDIQQFYSVAEDSLVYKLREAYAELFFSGSDLRIGKQIITWGRADGGFIADILSPVDLSEFLTRDFADLRTGVTAISYNQYFGRNYVQLILNPVFVPNQTPRLNSRWFPRAIVSTSFPAEIVERRPRATLKNIQLAGRYAFRSALNFDLDIFARYWHYPNPSYLKNIRTTGANATVELTENFTQSFIAGYSGSLKLTDKLFLKSESAFYTNRTFDYLSNTLQNINLQNPSTAERIRILQLFNQNSDGFLRDRPWLVSMIGLSYRLFDYSVSAQVINEHIFNYDQTILQEQNYYYGTLLIQKKFFRDTWNLRLFGRYNFSGNDYWVNPEITYQGIDSFEASLGSQLFGGETPEENYGHLSFNNFKGNTFGYLKISAFF